MNSTIKVLYLIGLLSFLLGCSSGQPPTPGAEPKNSQGPNRVTRGELLVEVEAPITTTPVTEAVLRSPSSGNLVLVPTIGQKVKAQEVIARLDTQALERAIIQAQIGVEEAQLSLDKQNQTLEILRTSDKSNQTLAQSQLITQESLASSRATLKKEELQYQSLELNLKKAKLSWEEALENRDDAWIRSPVDGVVSSVSEDSGTYVEKNTEICRVVDISVVTLTGQVDEYDIGKLQVGQEALAVFEALPGETFLSKIKTVSPTAKTENNVPVYSITAQMPNPKQTIRPGMSGDLTVTITKKSGLLIPLGAVSTVRTRSYVEIFKQGEKTLIPVVLGPNDGKQVLVISGLEEGQELTYEAQSKTAVVKSQTDTTATTNQTSLMGLSGAGGGPGAGGPPPGGF